MQAHRRIAVAGATGRVGRIIAMARPRPGAELLPGGGHSRALLQSFAPAPWSGESDQQFVRDLMTSLLVRLSPAPDGERSP